ncbi:DMT family transporter [Legionella tunisiensis]|uniref:DMT family transporter n=1 Tax=Legionella tunisiensis TaxID=1034944 RepID=UPI0002D8800B|nr:DMT family transporter [Legionella tunisiensis]
MVLLPLLIFFHWNPASLTGWDWFILLGLGLSSGFFYVFWSFGSKRVDALLASLSTAIMPLATVILAWLLLGEQLTKMQCLGMSLVIFSIGIYARRN